MPDLGTFNHSAVPRERQYLGWFQLHCSLGNGRAKDGWLLGHGTNKAGLGRAKLLQKASTSALLLAHSGRLALMAVCELAGLAGVLCWMLTQPTPAATATVSQLARIAADMIARSGGNAVNPSPVIVISPLWRSLSCIMNTVPVFTS